MLLAALAVAAMIAFRGIRFWILIGRNRGAPLAAVARATFTSFGLSTFLLANAGEVARIALVRRASTLRVPEILGAVVADRTAEFVGFGIVALVTVMMFPLPVTMPAPAISYGVVAALITIAILIWLVGRGEITANSPSWRRATHALMRSIGVAARTALRTIASRRFAAAVAITTLSWLSMVVAFAMTARAAGVAVSLAATLSAVVVVSIGSVVRTTPGNVGVFQFLYALAVVPFGVQRMDAIAVGVLIQSIQAAVGIFGAGVCLPWTARSMLRLKPDRAPLE